MNVMSLLEAQRELVYNMMTHPCEETLDELEEVQKEIMRETCDRLIECEIEEILYFSLPERSPHVH